jgi:hypothetical protein
MRTPPRIISIPNQEQLEALQCYATNNGRTWKSRILEEWFSARGCDDCLLQQVRNSCGPQWLRSKYNTIKP